MTSRLNQVVSATNVASGDSAILTHAINVNGVAALPDFVFRDNGDFAIVATTTTTVTVRNDGLAAADVNVWLWRQHSFDRAYGGSGTTSLSPQPFVPAAGGATSASDQLFVDLSAPPYNVVANDDDQTVADANTVAINQAILDYDGLYALLMLPQGLIYVGQAPAGAAYSINFFEVSKLELAGQGKFSTIIVQQGPGDGGDWHALQVDRSQDITLSRFGIMQGIIERPDTIQLNHLINIANNSNDGSGTTEGVYGYDLSFGKAIGDQLRFFGNTAPIQNCRFQQMVLHGAGTCLRSWTALTTYVAGDRVINDSGNNYVCMVGGISGNSGGPTGTGTGIVDGSVTWDYSAPRVGARSGVSFQRGYSNVEVFDFYVDGVQNSPLDMEPTGSGTMEFANVHDFYIDNAVGGRTAYAASFSGVSVGSRTANNRLANGTLTGGALSIISTDNVIVEGVKSVCNTLFAADTTTPNIIIRQRNDNMILRDIEAERGGTCAAGNLLDIENPAGTGLTIDGFTGRLVGINGSPIFIEAATRVAVRRVRVYYSGAAPSARDVVGLYAINANCNHPLIEDIIAETSAGKFQSIVGLYTRSGQSMTNIMVRDIQASGHTNYGVLFSFGAGTTFDAQPFVQSVNTGSDPVYRAEDAAGVEINTVYPTISGNIGGDRGVRQMVGTQSPEGVVTATQGCMFVRINGDTTSLWFKQTGTGNTGWVQITIP